MKPKPKQEVLELLRNALASLGELDKRTRVEILESDAWSSLILQPSPQLNTRLHDYFEWRSGLRDENPGYLLEEIAYLLFRTFIGIGNTRSFQSYAAQHDLVVDGNSNAWVLLMQYLHLPTDGRSIVVECKNQTSNLTDQQFSRLCGILQNKFASTAHLGVFISRTAASGFPKKGKKKRTLSDSRATQALFHAKTGKYVIVIDHADLQSIYEGASFARILEAKIREVEASAGINLEYDEDWTEVLLPPHLAKYQELS